jgi:hypothetical protein
MHPLSMANWHITFQLGEDAIDFRRDGSLARALGLDPLDQQATAQPGLAPMDSSSRLKIDSRSAGERSTRARTRNT